MFLKIRNKFRIKFDIIDDKSHTNANNYQVITNVFNIHSACFSIILKKKFIAD